MHQPPIKDSQGKIPWGRYIAGADPYDDDSSETLSLGSLYILDLKFKLWNNESENTSTRNCIEKLP